jgi:hypothetical protein
VREVVFCESFLSYVASHPLLERAVLSGLGGALLPAAPGPALSAPAPAAWARLAFWQARPQHAMALTLLAITFAIGMVARCAVNH